MGPSTLLLKHFPPRALLDPVLILIQCGVSTGLGLEQGTKGEEVSVESLVWGTVLVLSLVPGGQTHEGRSLRLAAARSPPIGRDLDPPPC